MKKFLDYFIIVTIGVLMIVVNWFENTWWSWKNCIEFRLEYNDIIDYKAFWEELNIGSIQIKDEWIMSQPGFDPYNLSGRDPYYNYTLSK